jgi:hypothetical protein
MFIGKDPESPNGDSPSVWDDGENFVIQGWTITDRDEIAELLLASGQSSIPGHETLIRFPKRLAHFLVEMSTSAPVSDLGAWTLAGGCPMAVPHEEYPP